jgi:hypothetical protein
MILKNTPQGIKLPLPDYILIEELKQYGIEVSYRIIDGIRAYNFTKNDHCLSISIFKDEILFDDKVILDKKPYIRMRKGSGLEVTNFVLVAFGSIEGKFLVL